MPMPPITFRLAIFEGPFDRPRSSKVLLWLLESLVQVNVLWLGAHPETPTLYKSDVLYQREDGTENWQDIPTTLRLGFGDCEDLACYRTAELRYHGINAHPFIRWRRIKKPNNDRSTVDPAEEGPMMYHALCRWPDGRIEDPSMALGMRGAVSRKPTFVEPEGALFEKERTRV